MIKYEGIENKYFYNKQDVENILKLIKNGKFYNMNNCTQENVSDFINAVNNFMSNIRVENQKVILERKETEEEARDYFGYEFIEKFDKLLTSLDQQKTIVAIHGTCIETCSKICENGLKYKLPSLSSTAIEQSMAFGQRKMHYENYESLLNWKHKNYKGLVIIAIPYECYYNEGLWNHFQETNSSFYGGQDYRIDPDFIVGFIDVTSKQIVMNPKYNRQHDYTGYCKDNDLFRKQSDMNNEKFVQLMIEEEQKIQQDNSVSIVDTSNEQRVEETIDIERIPDIIEDLEGTFNSIKMGFSECMSESKYKYLLEELSYGFSNLQKILPLLKTDDQVKKEQEEKFLLLNQNDSFNFDWGDGVEWDDSFEEENNKIL